MDCFYEGENMLVIHPEECIDCGVCVPECPAEAIFSDAEPQATEFWLELNRKYSAEWPNIISKKEPPADADAQNGRAGKACGVLAASRKGRCLNQRTASQASGGASSFRRAFGFATSSANVRLSRTSKYAPSACWSAPLRRHTGVMRQVLSVRKHSTRAKSSSTARTTAPTVISLAGLARRIPPPRPRTVSIKPCCARAVNHLHQVIF